MKVLMRDTLKWVDAKFDPLTNRIVDGSLTIIYENNILSVKDDDRTKYVVCSKCGKIIPNTPKAIKEHKEASCSSAACFACPYMAEHDVDTVTKKYTLNEDGTYTKNLKENMHLVCTYVRYSKGTFDINSEEARKYCNSRGCMDAQLSSIDSVFIKYPDLFDTMITVDMLNPKCWNFYEKDYYDGYIFKARKRFALYAHVNSKGIVTKFVHAFGRSREDLLYSHKYNKLFWDNNCKYHEKSSIYSSYEENIREFLHNIYEEANAND